MKKYVLHASSFTVGLLAVGFVAARFMYATGDTIDRAAEEHRHLASVVKTAQQVIADGQNLATSFLDTADNHSVSWYVQEIELQLSEINQKLIFPIEKVCNEPNHTDTYITILKKTHTLLMEIRKNLQTFLIELQRNQANKNPISFAKAMKDLDKKLSPRAQMVREKLAMLHKAVVPFDQEIGQQVQRFLNDFDDSQKNGRSTAAALKGIAHRVKC